MMLVEQFFDNFASIDFFLFYTLPWSLIRDPNRIPERRIHLLLLIRAPFQVSTVINPRGKLHESKYSLTSGNDNKGSTGSSEESLPTN